MTCTLCALATVESENPMTIERYICDACHRPLKPNEPVVEAAQLHDVTTQDSSVREYQEGLLAFFHPSHVPAGWRPKAKGPLSTLRPNAS